MTEIAQKPARQHRFKVHIEGIRVPCIGATINIQVDQSTTSELELPATAPAFNVLPRALVHLFWWERDAWRLIFEGEAVTRGYRYAGGNRSAVIGCQDLTLYWQEAYRLFFSLTAPTTVRDRKLYAINPHAENAVTTFFGKAEVGNVLEEIFQFSGENASGVLAEALDRVFAFMEEINTYFAWGVRRTKIRNKIKTIDNPTALSILAMMGGIFSTGLSLSDSSEITLWSLIQALNNYLFYHLVSNPAPAYLKPASVDITQLGQGIGKLSQVVLHPEVYFAPPPRCNVILPPLFEQLHFQEDWTTQPTRTMVTQAFGVEIPALTYYAPAALQQYMATEEARYEFLLPEERLRGMRLDAGSISAAEVRGQGKFTSQRDKEGKVSEENIRELVSQIVTYQHHRARFATRAGSGTGPFNPFLVPGLPAAVVDRTAGFLVGDLTQITHELHFQSGLASTSFAITHARWLGLPFDESYLQDWQQEKEQNRPEGHFEAEGKPSWYDETLFSDERIGPTLYATALGYEDPYYGTVKQVDETGALETLEEALTRVRRLSLLAEDPMSQALAYCRRELATEFETFLALGAEPDDEEQVERLQERNLDEPLEWSYWRKCSRPQYRNPGNETQSYLDEGDIKGPFIRERQEWVKAFLRSTESEAAHAF